MIKPQYLLLMGLVLFALLFVSFTISVQQSSPLKQFNVSPDVIHLNWTNNYASNITITINETFNNITVKILNDTSVVRTNYSQTNTQDRCKSGPDGYYLFVIDVNESNSYNNIIGPLNATNSSIATIIDTDITYNHLQCSPGRYWVEKFTIRNTTQTNETANITVFIDIPISASNNADFLTTGIESFGGGTTSLPSNATTYHSYYFNITELSNGTTNVTGVAINLTGWSSTQDADLFLFDNSTTPLLKAKSINKTNTEEWLLYNYLPSDSAMWEIRVFGNSTSAIDYSGYVAFTGLNVLNASDGQRLSSIDLGVKNASDTAQVNITLRNELNLTSSNIVESKELYHVDKFSGSGTQNFTFIVPDSSIASKVRVSLNWTGGSNYSFNLYNQDDSLVGSSVNKYAYANVTGAMQEEYNETSSIGSSSGLWKVEVRNNTAVTDSYDVTVYVHVSPSNWIATNYTTMSLNRTGEVNYTTSVQINFTVQNTTMDGLYEGYLRYLDNNKAGIEIPISINVTTPMLVVSNTLNSTVYRLDENYGTNLTRSLNFILNNTGSYDLSVILTNSSNNTLIGSGGYFANFTYNSISSIGKYSSQTLNVNVTFNSSLPTGIYEGWIFINGTNSIPLSSHPYETFNLTLRLNLTNSLDVQTLEIRSVDGDTTVGNASMDENVTVRFRIYYINGTEIEAGNKLNTSNFTIWLVSRNVTTYRIPPTSGSLDLYNGTNPIYLGSPPDYEVNATVPANKPGGFYTVYVTTSYTRNPSFTGTGTNQTLIINNTGLKLTAITPTSFSFYEGGSASYLNISVTNYGPVNAGGRITMDDWGYATITANWANNTCYETKNSSGRYFTFDASNLDQTINANGNETCVFSWKIQPASSVTQDRSTSSLKIYTTDSNFGNITGISITVEDNVTATTTTVPTTTGDGGTTGNVTSQVTGAAEYIDIIDYPTSISVEQGGSKTVKVTVNNTNKTLTQNVILGVKGIDSSWYSVNPSTSVRLKRAESYVFEVTFNIPNNASIGDYSGKFNATSFYQFETIVKIYDTVLKDFTLKVTPGEALKSEIISKLSNYTSEMNNLEQQINQSKEQGYNTSEVESLFNQLKTKIDQANDYVNKGDYTSAYNLLDDIASLISQIKGALTGLSPITGRVAGTWWSWGKWVVVVVVAVVVGVLGYMFWPTKLGEAKPKPVVTAVEGKDKISETFAKLREKWKKIREGRKT